MPVYFLKIRCRLTFILKTPETMQSHIDECMKRKTYSVHLNVCRKHFNELLKYHSVGNEQSAQEFAISF